MAGSLPHHVLKYRGIHSNTMSYSQSHSCSHQFGYDLSLNSLQKYFQERANWAGEFDNSNHIKTRN